MTYIKNVSGDVENSNRYNWALKKMKADWDAYFKGVGTGVSIHWADGTLTNNGDGTATYINEGHPPVLLVQADYNFFDIAQIPAVGALWVQQYGYNPATYGFLIPRNMKLDYSLGAGDYWTRQRAYWQIKLGLPAE